MTKKIQATIFVDSNHGHDEITGKSIAGMIGLLASTPVTWLAKRKSSVMTSTFGSEFISLKKVAEEAIVCRCYCRSFGMRATKPTLTHEDNVAIVINSIEPGIML